MIQANKAAAISNESPVAAIRRVKENAHLLLNNDVTNAINKAAQRGEHRTLVNIPKRSDFGETIFYDIFVTEIHKTLKANGYNYFICYGTLAIRW